MASSSSTYRKKILLFSITGLLLLTAFFGLVDMGVRHSDFSQVGKVNKVVNHTIDPLLMVFGSSVSEVGLDPLLLHKKTGLSVYNCSFGGTRFMQYKGLIDEFSTYSSNNKYVVLVETYFSFEKVDALATPENFLSQVGNNHVYNALYNIQPDLVWKSRYVPFYKYVAVTHDYYKNAVIGWKNIIRKSNNNDPLLGFDPVDKKWEADADEAIRSVKPFAIQIDSGVVNEYKATIERLRQKGKKVILVLTPIYTAMLSRITDISPLREELKRISTSTGALFIDYSQSLICDNKGYFYNSNHLNRDGAEVFSAALGDSLHAIIP